jgi:hypothetical protein
MEKSQKCARRFCDVKFAPKRSTQLFCSGHCRNLDKHERRIWNVEQALVAIDKMISGECAARGHNSKQYREMLALRKLLRKL